MNRGYPPTALGRPALAANRVGREAGYVPWGASGFLAVLSRTRPPPRLTAVSQRSDAAPVRGPYLDASDPDPSWPAPSPSHPDDGSGAPTTRRRALLWVMAVVGLLTVTVAALALIDMIKAVDPAAVITDVRVEEKTGGKTGHWSRDRQD